MEDLTIVDKICLYVSEFNYLFGVINYNYDPKSTVTLENLFINTTKEYDQIQIKLRYNLIKEESFELVDAFEQLDSIEIIDSLCDILYVSAGAKVYFNLSNDLINKQLLNENLDKKTLEFDSLNENSFDLIKPTIISNESKFEELVEKLKYLLLELQNQTEDIIREHEIFDKNIISKYSNILDEIIYLVFKISDYLSLNIYELFVIVHKSNMTKICPDLDTAIKTVEWYKLNELRYPSPNFREIEYNNKKYWVIYDEQTNKILKSIDYYPARFI
jgi:predicted HAD superfamily Cof-like phosphohydrolase